MLELMGDLFLLFPVVVSARFAALTLG